MLQCWMGEENSEMKLVILIYICGLISGIYGKYKCDICRLIGGKNHVYTVTTGIVEYKIFQIKYFPFNRVLI